MHKLMRGTDRRATEDASKYPKALLEYVWIGGCQGVSSTSYGGTGQLDLDAEVIWTLR